MTDVESERVHQERILEALERLASDAIMVCLAVVRPAGEATQLDAMAARAAWGAREGVAWCLIYTAAAVQDAPRMLSAARERRRCQDAVQEWDAVLADPETLARTLRAAGKMPAEEGNDGRC